MARAEVALSADILDYYATHAEAFLNPRAIHESPGAVCPGERLYRSPVGPLLVGVDDHRFSDRRVVRVLLQWQCEPLQ